MPYLLYWALSRLSSAFKIPVCMYQVGFSAVL